MKLSKLFSGILATYRDGKDHVVHVLSLNELQKPIPYFIDTDNGYQNAGIKYGGQVMRYRGEVLVFSDNFSKIYICESQEADEGGYYIPGGGAEPDRDLLEQTISECREEAAMEIKNIKYSGMQHVRNFNNHYPKWHVDILHPKGLIYDGYFSEMYIAEYDKPLEREVQNTKDIDGFMRKNGKFIDIIKYKSYIRLEHKLVIEKVWKDRNMNKHISLTDM